jgi:hypothetical protein
VLTMFRRNVVLDAAGLPSSTLDGSRAITCLL